MTYFYFCIFLSYSLFWGTQYIKIHFSVPLVFSRAVHLSAFILAISFLVLNIVDAKKIKVAFADQQQSILQQSSTSQRVTVAKLPLPMENHILYYMDISSDKEAWANRAQSKFHGVESISAF